MRDRLATVALLAAVVAAGALVPALAAGRPANQIPVAEVDTDALSDPGAAAWSDVEPVEVALSSAPSGVPDAADTSVRTATVRAAHTSDRFYLRLSWADATRDDAIDGPRAFADAAAIQLPANATTSPAIAMGGPRTPVNVWYWSADAGSEELLAGGPGSTTRLAGPAVGSRVTYADGRWHVVFSRALSAPGDRRTDIRTDRDLDVALAVWNGSNMERSGRKAVSEWYTFALGPPPRGAPYETILWAIAGVAIAVVIVVTLLAVRRTGGGAGGD